MKRLKEATQHLQELLNNPEKEESWKILVKAACLVIHDEIHKIVGENS